MNLVVSFFTLSVRVLAVTCGETTDGGLGAGTLRPGGAFLNGHAA